jgi:CHASE3 domain sensor protein
VYEAATRSSQLARDRAWIAHTFEVIVAAQSLKSTAQDAERAQRGYLLTGEPAYLETYQARADTCPMLLEHLRQLTVDNPEQQRRMPNLGTALEEWLAERKQTVDVYREQGFNATQQLIRSRAHLDTLRTLDSAIEATVSTERDLLNQRQERAAQDEKRVS